MKNFSLATQALSLIIAYILQSLDWMYLSIIPTLASFLISPMVLEKVNIESAISFVLLFVGAYWFYRFFYQTSTRIDIGLTWKLQHYTWSVFLCLVCIAISVLWMRKRRNA